MQEAEGLKQAQGRTFHAANSYSVEVTEVGCCKGGRQTWIQRSSVTVIQMHFLAQEILKLPAAESWEDARYGQRKTTSMHLLLY